jgi:hypothetical protein
MIGGDINGVVNLSRCIPPKMYYGGPIGFTSVEESRLLFHELDVLGSSDMFRREFKTSSPTTPPRHQGSASFYRHPPVDAGAIEGDRSVAPAQRVAAGVFNSSTT